MTVPLARPGYPLIEDAEHPLWDAQQAGWPDHTAYQAMAEAADMAPQRRGDSADHPAYAEDRIVNTLATRPADEPAPVAQPTGRR